MKSFKGRPVITGQDHPKTIYDALQTSMRHANAGDLPEPDPSRWIKQAQDAYGALDDGFKVSYPGLVDIEASQEEVTLWMTPDQLEFALVCHGLKHLENQEELANVNAALVSLDGIKSQVQR